MLFIKKISGGELFMCVPQQSIMQIGINTSKNTVIYILADLLVICILTMTEW